ncbi:prolyl oligopeptidase family serine peptidase [Galbibacter sp. PAP.153]|uniref:alpha/beta hydrolase family protein n=1 Tax=Galbibacter sp. PAP.153 TaxID=3104623 RepID=UPI00300B4771
MKIHFDRRAYDTSPYSLTIYPMNKVLGCLLFLFHVFGIGQNTPESNIKPEDYKKWYGLYGTGISDDGHWYYYTKHYQTADSLTIKEVKGDKHYTFPQCGKVDFLGGNLVGISCGQRQKLVNLLSGNIVIYESGTKLRLSKNKNHLIIYNRKQKELKLTDLSGSNSMVFSGVYKYAVDKKIQNIAICANEDGKSVLKIIAMDADVKVLNNNLLNNRKVLDLYWDLEGRKLAYTLSSKERIGDSIDSGLLKVHDLRSNKTYVFNPENFDDFPLGYQIIRNSNMFRFSNDGKRVFFAYREKPTGHKDPIPEIWKSNDPYIHDRMKWLEFPMVGMWTLHTNRFLKVTDAQFPDALLNGDQQYALVYNSILYEPQSSSTPPVDLYVMNLRTGKRALLLEKYPLNAYNIRFSPSGQYSLYFKENQWWLYDFKRLTHHSLSKKLNKVSEMPYLARSPLESPPPGWNYNETELLMFDAMDLWSVPIANKPAYRITNGRDTDTKYRMSKLFSLRDNSNKGRMHVFGRQERILLSLKDTKKDQVGYSIWEKNHEITHISHEHAYLSWPHLSSNGNVLSYVEEKYDRPPRLILCDLDQKRSKVAFQSNPHYKTYREGVFKIIHYRNKNGDELSGLLRFPLNYQKDSLYPTVVRVYERQMQYKNRYTNPSFYNVTGFNPKNLVADGYFVFLPDIQYTIGEPGFSAADCIVSGIKEIMKVQGVNPKKIGLIGHSFGGYETLFAITQTDLFATAIAGAGISDYIRHYMDFDGTTSLNFDDLEYGQLRMGASLFDDYLGYIKNSPLYHADSIHVPFLLWSGKEDYHVNKHQSVLFHLAMKRLGKPNTFLFYPGEDHNLSDPESQKDATIRFHQWFDHYLKDEPKKGWMP